MARRRSGLSRPTIVDVAELSEVSRQTVSRVLLEHPRVADATRARVKGAILTLGYRPNRMAQALVTQSTLTFGFAATDMRDLHFGTTCSGVRKAAQELGYHLIVTEYDMSDNEGVGTLESLLMLGVDGIAIFPSFLTDDSIQAFAARSGCPIVMMGRVSQIPGVVSIAMDEALAAEILINHLVSRGKRNIGILMNEVYPEVIHDRYFALEQAIAKATGVAKPPVRADFPGIAAGRSAAVDLLTRHPEVDAIVGFNDVMAMGALLGCRDMGRSIPDDVAVVGYDGISFGEVSDPSLTTIVQDSVGMADAAFEALISCLDRGAPPDGELQVWSPELLVRGST